MISPHYFYPTNGVGPSDSNYKGGIYLVPQYSNRGFTSVKPE